MLFKGQFPIFHCAGKPAFFLVSLFVIQLIGTWPLSKSYQAAQISDCRPGFTAEKKKKKKPEMKATVQSEALMHEQNERGCKAWVLSTTRWSITVCVRFKLPLRRRKQTLGPVAVWENRTTSRKMVHFTLANTCLLWTKHSGSQPFFFSGTDAREL